MESNSFAMCLAKTTEFGLGALFGDGSAQQHDATLSALGAFRPATSTFVKDILRGDGLDAHEDIPKTLWEESAAINVFFPEAGANFDGVLNTGALINTMEPIFKAFASAAANYLDDTVHAHSWFVGLLKTITTKKQDMWPSGVCEINESDLAKLRSELEYACSIMDLVGAEVTMTKSFGHGVDMVRCLPGMWEICKIRSASFEKRIPKKTEANAP